MQIKYSEYHPDPNLRNVTRSIDNASGRAAIGSGLAVEVPYKTYQARLSAEASAQTAGVCQDVTVSGVEWGFTPAGRNFSVPTIVKRCGSETTHFNPSVTKDDGKGFFTTEIIFPDGCPESIKRQWSEAADQVYVPQDYGLEAAKSAQDAANALAETATYKYLRRT